MKPSGLNQSGEQRSSFTSFTSIKANCSVLGSHCNWNTLIQRCCTTIYAYLLFSIQTATSLAGRHITLTSNVNFKVWDFPIHKHYGGNNTNYQYISYVHIGQLYYNAQPHYMKTRPGSPQSSSWQYSCSMTFRNDGLKARAALQHMIIHQLL